MILNDWFSRLLRLPSAQQLQDMNVRLRREAEAHEATLRELEAARRELETRVEDRTKELSLVKARFETALHALTDPPSDDDPRTASRRSGNAGAARQVANTSGV